MSGDLSAGDLAAWEAAGLRPKLARDWYAAGFSPEQARAWVDSPITQPAEAATWRDAGFGPSDALPWRLKSVSPALARALVESGRDGGDPVAARLRFKLPQWEQAGFSVSEAIGWAGVSFEPDRATAWREAGFGPEEAARWANLRREHGPFGRSPQEARAACERGETPDEALQRPPPHPAKRPTRATPKPRAASPDPWRRRGLSAQEGARWEAAGFGPAEAAAWRAQSIREPERAREWVERGVTPEVWQGYLRSDYGAPELTRGRVSLVFWGAPFPDALDRAPWGGPGLELESWRARFLARAEGRTLEELGCKLDVFGALGVREYRIPYVAVLASEVRTTASGPLPVATPTPDWPERLNTFCELLGAPLHDAPGWHLASWWAE